MPASPSSEPEPAEQVQRAVAVAAHERDREQVEEAAQVALERRSASARAARGRWFTGSSATR